MLVLLASAGIALLVSLLATPLFIRGFARIGWGQFIRDDGPQSHHVKRGTPTMGGLIFIVATLAGYFGGKLLGQDPPTCRCCSSCCSSWGWAPSASSTTT